MFFENRKRRATLDTVTNCAYSYNGTGKRSQTIIGTYVFIRK